MLILDGPPEGIPPNIIDQIGDTVRLLRREGRMSILLVEQYLDFAKEFGDVFYIMDRSAVVANGPIAALNEAIVQQYLTV